MMASETDVYQLAVDFANRAVTFDRDGKIDAAIYFYQQAAYALRTCQHMDERDFSSMRDAYEKRATELKDKGDACMEMKQEKSGPELVTERAKVLCSEALDADNESKSEEAVNLYAEAVKLCLEAREMAKTEEEKKQLTQIAEMALERAEHLKGIQKAPDSMSEVKDQKIPGKGDSHGRLQATTPTKPQRIIPPLGIGNISLEGPKTNKNFFPFLEEQSLHRGSSQHLQLSGSDAYTQEELEVIRKTSCINNREYVPFMFYDLKEKFSLPMPFTDVDLALSPKQRRAFARWARPHELSSDPKVIQLIDPYSIRQTVVSDCSFVASLSVSALYEKKFKCQIITDIIYPRNRTGYPVYNPCGKYMVKLHINGVPRKVIIDDRLPLGKHGELLCSYSSNRNELWVSLLEKAYMRVMGGYDFPGSNSNIDLHALTGWIPDRTNIREGDGGCDKDAIFQDLYTHFHRGNVLATLATGEMSDAESERTGLVSTHAYAILDIQEIKGERLFMLKNPWSHVRWKGNYSELDTRHWTPELRTKLNFDPTSAKMFDNGVFWIDYQSVCKYFDVLYKNWNPGIFLHKYYLHHTWNAGVGPAKDLYNVSNNPQYSLTVTVPPGKDGKVWVLLTRHIVDIQDFRDNREYICLLVYKTGGKKVYYPYDPPPYLDGVRINSPHYLCKIHALEPGTNKYTLVVSQYEKMNTIHYTLAVYSKCPFSMQRIKNPFTYKKQVTGEWKGLTAGGCANNRETYSQNPRFRLALNPGREKAQVLIELRGPREYSIGFDLLPVVIDDPQAQNTPIPRKSSGPYRSGFVVLELEDISSGSYDIIPSTFRPKEEGPFIMCVQTSCPLSLSPLT
ncbi:unnamed protein product [Darwinula stevensoni]|uniref:Calpain catalytic domain-containing protein n=1 Tax=Darwinula stevensoni TaxID=69355 RepID=A0A7R9A5Z4_9CRUS|nr:unnamed protein product [Darwinula stevensoni]CAG0886383.1 unnamed protein product [Darwinula stevensoni]